jgi:hypothetical protein
LDANLITALAGGTRLSDWRLCRNRQYLDTTEKTTWWNVAMMQ